MLKIGRLQTDCDFHVNIRPSNLEIAAMNLTTATAAREREYYEK